MAVGLAIGLTFGLAAGLATGLTAGLAIGLATGLTGWQYLALLVCTRRWSRHRLPWRLGHFLAWSYDAGLIRTAASLQFRHRELQDYLARNPAP